MQGLESHTRHLDCTQCDVGLRQGFKQGGDSSNVLK